MSIIRTRNHARNHEAYAPVCDICGEELPAEDTFGDAVYARKEAGWKSRKTSDGWEDWCPDCHKLEEGKY